MNIEQKIILTINDQTFELTHEEARTLWKGLGELFREDSVNALREQTLLAPRVPHDLYDAEPEWKRKLRENQERRVAQGLQQWKKLVAETHDAISKRQS